jgi:hypothetical protein
LHVVADSVLTCSDCGSQHSVHASRHSSAARITADSGDNVTLTATVLPDPSSLNSEMPMEFMAATWKE